MMLRIFILYNILISSFSLALRKSTDFNAIAGLTRQAFPQVIGHAGASGYVPESSLIGYDLAANLLADYSEPDVVLTADSHFIAMHDLTLEGTTNVADLYPASRMETFVVEGVAIKGYYAVNFTLSEIKTLRLHQRFEGRSQLYDGIYSPPTLEEIIQWQLDHYSVSNRLVGIYPELKHPDWYGSIGYPMEDLFLDVVSKAGYHVAIDDPDTPRDMRQVVPLAIQCFKSPSLKYLSKVTSIPLVQLIGTNNLFPTPLSAWNELVLDDVATYAQVASPDKNMFTLKMNTTLEMAVEMVSWARSRGLLFVAWSFQLESKYIAPQFNNNSTLELEYFYGCLEAAGLFHEFPDHAREVVARCVDHTGSGHCFNLCTPFMRANGGITNNEN